MLPLLNYLFSHWTIPLSTLQRCGTLQLLFLFCYHSCQIPLQNLLKVLDYLRDILMKLRECTSAHTVHLLQNNKLLQLEFPILLTLCTYTSQNKKIKCNQQFSSIKLVFHAVFRTSFQKKKNILRRIIF